MKTVVVINAGIGTPSNTKILIDSITGAVKSHVSKRGDAVEIDSIDLRSLAHELATMMITGVAGEKLVQAKKCLSAADGVVAASPVFSASYTGLFKMFIDSLDTDALNGMPVLIAATGGTPRHALMLDYSMRPLFTYLRAIVMPTGVFAATEDFGQATDLTRRANRAASELATYVLGTPGVGEGCGPDLTEVAPQRHDGLTVTHFRDFEDLLRGHEG
ncbi:CE1759 family FMN reductase [Corynebacterium kroppenstedtii]|uniref:CE1759 family FMN reductase n=1 Tax=Corynebacterium sp. PCR 32 TaxID=3351342 RepID=UPI0030B45ADA